MKALFLASTILLSLNSFATCSPENTLDENVPAGRCYGQQRDLRQECSRDPSETMARIASKSSCSAAVELAKACAYGSSIDVQLAGEAGEVCLKGVESPTDFSTELLVEQKKKCMDEYGQEQGSLGKSVRAYCILSAIEAYNWLNRPRIE